MPDQWVMGFLPARKPPEYRLYPVTRLGTIRASAGFFAVAAPGAGRLLILIT